MVVPVVLECSQGRLDSLELGLRQLTVAGSPPAASQVVNGPCRCANSGRNALPLMPRGGRLRSPTLGLTHLKFKAVLTAARMSTQSE